MLPLPANKPPATQPAVTGLIQSSFYLKCIKRQSVNENKPPHIAKDPIIKLLIYIRYFFMKK